MKEKGLARLREFEEEDEVGGAEGLVGAVVGGEGVGGVLLWLLVLFWFLFVYLVFS